MRNFRTREELEQGSPSRADGLTPEAEKKMRRTYKSFILNTTEDLKL